MPQKILPLHWPMAGVVRKNAYRSQAPYSCQDAQNVRPDGVIEGRNRGGQRPGLEKSHYDLLGSGNPVRLLNQVTVVKTDGFTYETDDFPGTALGSIWSTANWGSLTAPGVTSDAVQISYGTAAGAVRSAVASIDTAQAYSIDLLVVPYQGNHWGKYSIYFRMDNTTPVGTTAGAVAELILTSAGTYSGTLKVYVAGTPTTYNFTSGDNTVAMAGWFRVVVTGNDVVVLWRGQTVLASQTISAAAGARMGFGVNATVASGVCLVDQWRIQYYKTTIQQIRRTHLVASSNGLLYKDTYDGVMAQVSATCTLASDRLLDSVERGQKLYIADTAEYVAKATNGATNSGAGTTFTSASYADWSASGVVAADMLCVITAGTGATAGVYVISSISAGDMTLATSPGVSASSITFYVKRAPKVYDPVAATLALSTATAGSTPMGHDCVALFRDRLVWAGDPENPHLWEASRQGTVTDYDYTAVDTDPQRAVSGTNANAGLVGDHIIALVAHSDDYLVFGGLNSVWIMRGDPVFGQVDCVSRDVGFVGKKAWCRGPGGEIVFLSKDGLYQMAMGGGGAQAISNEDLPDDLKSFDRTQNDVQLVYDLRLRGVWIFLTPKSLNAYQKHWFFDWKFKGFWPDLFPSSMEPTACLNFKPDNFAAGGTIMGGRDGYLRRPSKNMENDDGTTIVSYVKIGPITASGDEFAEGVVDELVGVLGTNSGTVAWSLFVADSHEEASEATTAMASGTWSNDGLNYTDRPRGRGMAFVVKLANSGARSWSFEGARAVLHRAGRMRKL